MKINGDLIIGDTKITLNQTAKLIPHILYDSNSNSGDTGNITLSDTAANYTYIEIYGVMMNGDYGYPTFYTKVDRPQQKFCTLFAVARINNTMQACAKRMYISNKTIVNKEGGYQDFNGNLVSSTNTIGITRVVGYK